MTLPLDAAFFRQPFAHRALHDVTDHRPENSLAAIKAALHLGYGLEIDVQLSADNAAMVFHDAALDRLTAEKGAVRSRTAEALQEVKLTGCTEGIPMLDDVLALVSGQVPLLIEIKDQDGAMGPDIGLLEQAVADSLRDYTGPAAVMSFNPHSVAKMKDLLPKTPRGLVTSGYLAHDWPLLPAAVRDRLRDIPDYDRCEASFISHDVSDLNRGRVAELKAQGAHIFCWTVTSPQMEREARRIADNITFEQYLAPISA